MAVILRGMMGAELRRRTRAESGYISDVPRVAREAGAGTLTERSGHSSGRR